MKKLYPLKWVVCIFMAGALLASVAKANGSLEDQLLETVTLGELPSIPFDAAKFKSLIAQGADVNAQNKTGQSVLLLTTIAHAYLADTHVDQQPLFEAMQLLMAKGANVNLADNLGITPLMHAVHRAYTGAVAGPHPLPKIKPVYDLLLSATHPSPDLNLRNWVGGTALFYLAKWGATEEVRRFISLGADLYNVDSDGNSLFQKLAFGATGADLLRSILEFVPEARRKDLLEQRNFSDSTALIQAVRVADVAMVNFLLDTYGVEMNQVNTGGENALSIAEKGAIEPRSTDERHAQFAAIATALRAHGASLPPVVDPSQLNCTGSNLEPFGLDKITALVAVCGVRDLDALIPLFPKSYLSNYVLGYAPRGAQKGSFSHPRVIASGTSGKTLLAFGGDPALEGFNSLEMIESKAGGHFEFHEVSFQGGVVRVSEKNPARCLACHGGPNPRPNWDTWYLWPGFYNSEQAALYPIERGHYAEFIANRNQGRYKNLLEPADSPTVFDWGIYDSNNTTKNFRMDFVVDNANSDSIVGEIVENSALAPFKYAVLAAMSCADRPETFLPERMNAQMPRGFDDLLKEAVAFDVEELLARITRQSQLLPGAPEGNYALGFLSGVYGRSGQSYETDRVSRLRYVIEGIGGKMEWSTSFDSRSKNNYTLHALGDVEAKLWKWWLDASNPQEAALYRIYENRYAALPPNLANYRGMFRMNDLGSAIPGVDPKPACDLLRELSLAALGR